MFPSTHLDEDKRKKKTDEDHHKKKKTKLDLQTVLRDVHVQGLLSLGSFVLGAVAHHGAALRQVEVERDEGAVLHAQCTQSGTIDLEQKRVHINSALNV